MFRVTRYPMISKTESGRVSKEIPGSGSGSGTPWALPTTTLVKKRPNDVVYISAYMNTLTVLNTVGGVRDPMPLSIRIPPDQHIPDVDFHPTSEALVSVALILTMH